MRAEEGTRDVLRAKYGYQPERQLENRAGFEPITWRQERELARLRRRHARAYNELVTLIALETGQQRVNGWRKADAMFVIGRLRALRGWAP